jgi:hypothetical protein
MKAKSKNSKTGQNQVLTRRGRGTAAQKRAARKRKKQR